MLIDCPKEKRLLEDVEEILRTLERVKMKLKAGKCTFGVKEWNFQWYYPNSITNGCAISTYLERSSRDEWKMNSFEPFYLQIRRNSHATLLDLQRMHREKQLPIDPSSRKNMPSDHGGLK
uniref:Uncharacterized protein n=1 Tax=Lactuca sativa TaxID=4236 RepID=A0A9R1VS13_LACSA|nr:hypothetical protein LSAT_V11C400223150 [Lactuca sativa]